MATKNLFVSIERSTNWIRKTMSAETRQAVVNNVKLNFTDNTQKSDFLDTTKTNTYTIAMIQWLLDNVYGPLLVLSVKSDHSPTGEHYLGCAVDLYPANWRTNEYTTCLDLMKGLSKCPFVEAVGLGGVTKLWQNEVQWPPSGNYPFVLFNDNDTDHLHAACANSVDKPGARAQLEGYTKYQG